MTAAAPAGTEAAMGAAAGGGPLISRISSSSSISMLAILTCASPPPLPDLNRHFFSEVVISSATSLVLHAYVTEFFLYRKMKVDKLNDIFGELWMSYLMANMVGYPPLQPFL